MKVAVYSWGGRRHVGLVSADGSEVTPLALDGANERGALPLIEAMVKGQPIPKASGPKMPMAGITVDAPLPHPRRNLFCVGRNYKAHAAELARTIFRDAGNAAEESWPMIFSKVPECVIANNQPIRLPKGVSDQIDYEAELAVIIGKGGANISARRAMEHVWGYTIVNDVTARDVQTRHKQWHLGKSFDTFCPMGPILVTADELDGTKTQLRCWVNGDLRQEASTADMIFDIPTLIETCSRGITLYPGDIIATGTPAGVGMGMTPPVYLKSGDVIRIEIEGIGRLENPVQ
jgi:2-keto-4-pentenoate hydratase/2-oxohepta-3-ene-1,7-dioic acid hydratase in catechol pathway